MTEVLSQVCATQDFENGYSLPEKNLLVAMLERALLDYLGNQRVETEEAYEWMYSDADINDEFSFNWICMHLDLCPSDVRENVQAMRRRGETGASRWWGIRRRA